MKTTRKETTSKNIEKMLRKLSSAKSKYVVFSSTLKPRHLTEKQIERAVEEVIALRKHGKRR